MLRFSWIIYAGDVQHQTLSVKRKNSHERFPYVEQNIFYIVGFQHGSTIFLAPHLPERCHKPEGEMTMHEASSPSPTCTGLIEKTIQGGTDIGTNQVPEDIEVNKATDL